MIALSQVDKSWAHKTIGNTNFTIGRWGCTITSICMIASKMDERIKPSPPVAAKEWSFTSNAEIIWTQSDFEKYGISFAARKYGSNLAEIKEIAESDEKAVILEVNRSHWVAVGGLKDNKLIVHDPIDGSVNDGLPTKYYITGYAVFDKVATEHWAEEERQWSAKHKIVEQPKEFNAHPIWSEIYEKDKNLAERLMAWSKSYTDNAIKQALKNLDNDTKKKTSNWGFKTRALRKPKG